jgi:hypothetical protein
MRLVLPPLTSSSAGTLERAPVVSFEEILTHKSLADLSL